MALFFCSYISREAVEIYACRGRAERIHTLSCETRYHTGENVACAARCHAGIAGHINIELAIRPGDYRFVALKNQNDIILMCEF
jgi:hypothetical protein